MKILLDKTTEPILTVKELREVLKDVPDELEVRMVISGGFTALARCVIQKNTELAITNTTTERWCQD